MKKKLFLLSIILSIIFITNRSHAQNNIVKVTSPAEFIKAIKSSTTIHFEPGAYLLTAADGVTTPNVHWEEMHDGSEPVISNVQNLVIEADEYTSLLIAPSYVYVLHFNNCKNISIKNLTLGHTDKGYCIGGVLNFTDCTDISIEDSVLFGSGTYGITLERAKNFRMRNSVIKECTYGLLQIYNCSGIIFSESDFQDTGEFDLMECNYSDVLFERCGFLRNKGYSLFKTVKSKITVKDSEISNNEVKAFTNYMNDMTLDNNEFTDNTFTAPVRKFGECTGDNVNVRAGQGFDFEVIHQLKKGEKVEILRFVRSSGNRLGVLTKPVKVKKGKNSIILNQGKALTVLNDEDDNYIIQVSIDNEKKKLRANKKFVKFISGFVKIKTEDNKTGWTVLQYIKETKEIKYQ